MSRAELRILAEYALREISQSGKLPTPISAQELLFRVVTYRPPAGLFQTDSPPRFRLTDLQLSTSWSEAQLSLVNENGTCTVLELSLGGSQRLTQSSLAQLNPRKRKYSRSIDEDADSATANEPEPTEDELTNTETKSPSQSLSSELKEVYNILQGSSAKRRLLAEQFRSPEESFEPICPQVTKADCQRSRADSTNPNPTICGNVHFRPVIRQHTDPLLGHCSYLNTCYSEPTYAQSPSMPPFSGYSQPNNRGPSSLPSGLGAAPCRYLHYEVDWDTSDADAAGQNTQRVATRRPFRIGLGNGPTGQIKPPLPPQWINCDIRQFEPAVLGKFHVIMADPPWDIHMSLPYGTMTDDEMRAMPIPKMQDEGLLFLWVTGRAMEVGRECMRVWGYTRIDEVVWVKTNQLQRVIRTGRTGHWLNHTKEHMLLKFPDWVNRGLDTDVIVSEVRETSRKPDEVYGLIERMCPGGRKVEIFGRKHNTRPGWLTLGNQIGVPDQISEPDLADRIRANYPERIRN
ncbi:MT-A70-domain-containing protein [Flagelloscypha sp. PMI_526]|nr:MT-A70-domain-containing protein [Flagelloscypha sp. PMI_526]